MKKLTVVISAYNEEAKIADCLDSVKFADEIILIDNSSIDKTSEIASNYTKNIFKRENNLMLNINKNFGFGKATGDFILSLDADERITRELAREIKNLLKKKVEFNGYYIPRKNIIFGKWIEHTGWYPDHQLRLFKKGTGKFAEKHVHEMIEIEGEVGYLKENMLHLNYETVTQFLDKLNRIYTISEAENLIASGYKLDRRDFVKRPVSEFVRRFFFQHGYKDGIHGLVLSLFMAFYHLVVLARVWEMQGFEQSENSLLDFEKAVKESGKEVRFWIYEEKRKREKNKIKKVFWSIKKKSPL